MKFIVAFILTALLSYAAGFYFPWWNIAIVAFVVAALIPQKPGKAFLSAFLSLFFLWAIFSFMIDVNNNHLLSEKIAQLFFKVKSHVVMVLVSGFIAGLTGGFAALAGSYLRKSK